MRILVIAPHPDDEILGCGGTIAKKAAQGAVVTVCIVTKGYPPLHDPSVISKGTDEDLQANEILGTKQVIRLDFPANGLESMEQHELNDSLKEVITEIEPDEVYIPFSGDIHIDHKLVAQAAMVALRPKYQHGQRVVRRILSYEVLSETGWDLNRAGNIFVPNVFEDIHDTIQTKMVAAGAMASQIPMDHNARSVEAIKTLAMYRGNQAGVNYAEAFMLEREVG